MDVVAAAATGYGGEEGVVRFGIIGCAEIARKVSRAIHLDPNAMVVVVGSRTLEKSRRFIADNWLDPAVVVAYGSYEEVLNDARVDAVYLSLPTSLHVQWAMVAAAGKGKHLLLEKAGERPQGAAEPRRGGEAKEGEAEPPVLHPSLHRPQRLQDGQGGSDQTITVPIPILDSQVNQHRRSGIVAASPSPISGVWSGAAREILDERCRSNIAYDVVELDDT
ncbi:hypothetical protein Taro_042121 [Colocasia esculenta]|uniref:Gfo/Idh/MocA-like oxidoreductase N-terminal domain-containing protein n=1 Tax=Colocasia esculenta TaxID=4460 RepID=A0A843WG19_COLES|nr:hypothetical protein [Colocasia esculenta]